MNETITKPKPPSVGVNIPNPVPAPSSKSLETEGDKHKESYRELAAQRNLAFCEAEDLLAIADLSLYRSIAPKYLERQRVIPITRINGKVVVAGCNPDTNTAELTGAFSAQGVEFFLITPTDYRRLRMALDCGMVQTKPAKAKDAVPVRDLLSPSGAAGKQLIGIFETLLLEAIAKRASDLHLERYGSRVRFRIRIDGDLHDVPHFKITSEQMAGILNIIKINAGLDIAEHRVPQGGRFSVTAGGQTYDLRVQTQPALHGEHVVIRLLSQHAEPIRIEQLGMPGRIANAFLRLLNSPSGLVLVVGPTGCGKSTTLYAGLHILATDETRKVITIEDPIEYAVDSIQQTQVRPDLGFSFANALRVFVRQDPDVIFLGEIRDTETAMEALRASQTGHIVLSTLHCNDSVDAVQRLFDLGMHPNSISSELLGIFAQRLAKRVCEQCRVPDTPPPGLLHEIFPGGPPADFRAFKGGGCRACNGFGSRGRIAVVEFLPTGAELRRAICQQVSMDELRTVAFKTGLQPMRDHALSLVNQGIIACAELPAMFTPEQLRPHPLF